MTKASAATGQTTDTPVASTGGGATTAPGAPVERPDSTASMKGRGLPSAPMKRSGRAAAGADLGAVGHGLTQVTHEQRHICPERERGEK